MNQQQPIAAPGGGPLTSASDKAASRKRTEAKGWKQVWNDDFNYRGLPDPKKWDYEEGLVRNNELQFYTRRRLENARVENGALIIEGRREPFRGSSYTAASLTTQGRFAFQFGRVEMRILYPLHHLAGIELSILCDVRRRIDAA